MAIVILPLTIFGPRLDRNFALLRGRLGYQIPFWCQSATQQLWHARLAMT